MKNIFLVLIYMILLSQPLYALKFENNASYQTCFTPGQNCTDMIVSAIGKAKNSVYVQAYSFTSAPIAKALLDAKKKGIEVVVILDKSQIRNNYSASQFFINNKIPIYVDHKPAIAHNKVILLDKSAVITGSFNFTRAAENKNAENLLIISDKNLAMKYLQNFNIRLSKSIEAYKYYGTESDNFRVRALKRRYNYSSPDVARWFPN